MAPCWRWRCDVTVKSDEKWNVHIYDGKRKLSELSEWLCGGWLLTVNVRMEMCIQKEMERNRCREMQLSQEFELISQLRQTSFVSEQTTLNSFNVYGQILRNGVEIPSWNSVGVRKWRKQRQLKFLRHSKDAFLIIELLNFGGMWKWERNWTKVS